MSKRTFTTLGIPIDSVGLGRAERHGTELSPAALRAAGLDRLGWADAGDLDVRIPDPARDVATGLVGLAGVLSTTSAVRTATADLLRRGDRPFLLGGCCTLLSGALAGARDGLGLIGLVYVDGHLDLYDGVTSPTGEAADMPIAVVLGDGPAPWVERVAPVPVTPPSGIAILGYHDPDELDDLGDALARNRAAGLFDADAATIRRDGPAATVAAAMAHVRRMSKRLWLHVDLDVLDQDVFPATDYLMSGGLDWDELVALLAPVAAHDELVGWSISCYNPEKDPGGAGGRAIVAAMERLFGG
ncbi:MAG TPA: arginase family protein [Candidatus Limnocylindrales bacterium]